MAIATQTMAARLTEPFAPGADSVDLVLTPTLDPSVADVASYDPTFGQHLARFEHQPDPLYLLVVRVDVTADISITIDSGPPAHSVSVVIPAGSFAGTSIVIPDAPRTGGSTVLRVRVDPHDVAAADLVGITVLLGTTARLLWVLGCERDQIRGHFSRVIRQRHIQAATGRSLDYIGSDLGIARFPPLPYSYDADTVALYHLDDQPQTGQAEVDTVEDLVSRYQPPGHPGTNIGRRAQSGVPGRFGRAFGFRDPTAEVQVPFATGLALGVNDSFTAECWAKPDVDPADGHLVSKHPDPSVTPLQAGWALSVGNFGRGVSANVRFLVSDGVQSIILFSDRRLSADRFHHLAGVVDRSRQIVSLYVDGDAVATQATGSLGSVASAAAEPVRIGRVGTAFSGLIDEVRLSGVARSSFHPVLGEDDEQYRRRLAIFRGWMLPTRSNLESVLNSVVGDIGGHSQPIVVDDRDSTLTVGELELTINPVALQTGAFIGADGDRRASENDASGPPDVLTFDPAFLITNSDPRLTFAPAPPRELARLEQPPDPHKMQVAVKRALAPLLDAVQPGVRIESAFDPRAADLRAVGRAVVLSHTVLQPGVLAAAAHRVGFDYVAVRTDGVYASCRTDDYLDIVLTPGGTATSAHGFDGLVNQTLVLTVDPPLPPGTEYRWSTIPCGAGRGCFVGSSGGISTCEPSAGGSSVTLRFTAPGSFGVKVESSIHGLNSAGNRTLRVGLDQLADHATIAADGSLGVPESSAGVLLAEDFFHPAFLLTHTDTPGVDFGTDVNHRRMQGSVADCLDTLVSFLTGTPGNLQVLAGFAPGATDLTAVGRGLTLGHQTLSAGQLGALASAAGFSFVHREGNQVFVKQAPGALLRILGPTVVDEGASAPPVLSVAPVATPSGVALAANSAYVACPGTDTLSELDRTSGQVRRAIKVGWSPTAVALNPSLTRAFTADANGNTVSVVDLATGAVIASVAVGARPIALAHHPSASLMYVACQGARTVQVIDTAALAVTATLGVASPPRGVAIRPDGVEVWIARDTANQVDIVPTAAFNAASVATLALPGGPTNIAFLPDGSRAYVTLHGAGQLGLVTVATRALAGTQPAGTAPGAVAVAPDSSAVFVGDQSTATPPAPQVLIFNSTGAPQGAVRIPDPAALAADVAHVYVASGAGNLLGVIDIAERGIANTFTLGSGLGERLSWVVRLGPPTQARLSSNTTPRVTLSPDGAGQAIVLAAYLLADHNAPYTFVVQLSPSLVQANPNVVIPKQQYDLIMNVLNSLRPAGVEVITLPIRERVIEVRSGLLTAFPDYTYPNYRVRGPTLRRPSSGGL
jgi:YVTN family beta-propeller protein